MDKINVTSKSAHISDIDLLYGRWIKEGAQFVEQEIDFWHPLTIYYAPKSELSFDAMKERIACELMQTGTKEVFDNISNMRFEVKYVPVIKLLNNVLSLYYSTKNQHTDLAEVFQDGKIAEISDLEANWDWAEMDTHRLGELSEKSMVLPTNRPFTMYNEMLQNVGGILENPKVYFVPVVTMNCTISGIPVTWRGFCGKKCLLLNRSGDFPEDTILKEGKFEAKYKSMLVMLALLAFSGLFLLIQGWIHQSGIGFILYLIFVTIVLVAIGYASLFLCSMIDGYILNPIMKAKIKSQLSSSMKHKKQSAMSAGFNTASSFDIKFEEDSIGDTIVSVVEK